MSASPPSPAFPLVPADAVAAIIVTPDGRFLMQRRDDLPHIWYPGAWALFGGAIEPGETEHAALQREIKEEIDYEITLDRVTYFTRLDIDFGFAGGGSLTRAVYEVPIPAEAVAGLRLLEGAEMRLIPAEEILALPAITGYDHFALYLYLNRTRIRMKRPG